MRLQPSKIANVRPKAHSPVGAVNGELLIHASRVLYEKLLDGVLFANIRFHDTVSRGRLLNRFGKDFEGIDSSLADNFGRSVIYFLSVITTLTTVSVVGGIPFLLTALLIGMLYYNCESQASLCSS